MAAPPIHVEILIACDVEELWSRTQEPAAHARWDVRFSAIDYEPQPGDDGAQRFSYVRRVLPGLAVRGWGETRGERERPDGSRASALAFGSEQRRSLIRRGSGYWRYEPVDGGVWFVTRYDYEPRWGRVGRAIDRVAFRPLIGWATAWSFDRVRLWIEEGVTPERSLRSGLVHGVATGALASAWLYQGVVPKLVTGRKEQVPLAVGLVATGFAVATVAHGGRRWPWLANLATLPVLAVSALRSDRRSFIKPVNPAPTFAMLGLAVTGLLAREHRPSAARCAREPR